MRRARRRSACGLLLFLSQSTPIVRAAPGTPVFSAGVDAVEVDVFVTSRNVPVTDLGAADFEVFDNGVRQEASLAQLEMVGVTAVLAIDTSQSVRGATLEGLKDASRAFVRSLTARDRAAILSFSQELTWECAATSDRAALERAVDRLTADGATAAFDALYMALKRRWSGGRPMVVLYSDGADNLSWLGAQTVLTAARESNALVYVIGPTSDDDTLAPARRPDEGSFRRLREIAEMTGGQFLSVESPARLRQRFLEILTALKTRYLLKYEPQGVARAGRHRIKVRVKNRKVDVRHRLEYSAPARDDQS